MKNEVKQYQCIGDCIIITNTEQQVKELHETLMDKYEPLTEYQKLNMSHDSKWVWEFVDCKLSGASGYKVFENSTERLPLLPIYSFEQFIRLKQNQQVKERNQGEIVEHIWDMYSRAVPEDGYSIDELNWVIGENVMLKTDFVEAVNIFQASRTPDAIALLEKRISELGAEINNTDENDWMQIAEINQRITELKNILKELKG